LAKGPKKRHKFIYVTPDFSDLDAIQTHWLVILKTIFTYKGKYNTQRIKVDQGVEPTKGFFFLLIEVDLTRKQFDAIIT